MASAALGRCVMAERREDKRLNILLITADDMNWDTPGCYGGTAPDITPNIDRLASEGLRFTNAHVTVAVCQPSRQTLMTGRYPHRFGAPGFAPIDTSVTTLPEVLSEAGYVNGCIGKAEHLQPEHKYNWSLSLDIGAMKFGRDPDVYYRHTRDFLATAAREGKPFFLMANSHDPHRPFSGSRDEKESLARFLDDIKPPSRSYGIDEVDVPGFLPDLADVRKEMAQYHSSSRRCDDTVGAILRALSEAGHDEDTLVMFLSDNGIAMPFAKWNCYLNSTKTPWIVRWPGKVAPNAVDDRHFISGIDFMPTILEAAGLDRVAGMDGRSFLPVILGRDQEGRDSVVTAFYQSMAYYFGRDPKDAPFPSLEAEGWIHRPDLKGMVRDFPIRCVQNRRFGYLFNEWSDGKTMFLRTGGLTPAAMARAAEDDPEIAGRMKMLLYRVPEEFYDFEADPNALNNLIGDERYRDEIDRMRRQLLDWMVEKADPVLPRFRRIVEAHGQP